MKIIVNVSLCVVIVAAFVLSFSSLRHLGELAGYGALAFLYPISIDAGALATCAAWLHRKSRQAAVMMWCLIAASVVLNATAHQLDATGSLPAWWLLTCIGACPPAIMGTVIHLAVSLHERDRLASPVPDKPKHVDPIETTPRSPTGAYPVARKPTDTGAIPRIPSDTGQFPAVRV